MPQGIEHVKVQLKVMSQGFKKVKYVAQNNPINEHASSKSEHDPEFLLRSSIYIKDKLIFLNVLIQLIDTSHILEKVQGPGFNKKSAPINITSKWNQRIRWPPLFIWQYFDKDF